MRGYKQSEHCIKYLDFTKIIKSNDKPTQILSNNEFLFTNLEIINNAVQSQLF